jgi:hypothetical protein
MENAPQKQPYDNLLKRLVQNQPNAILPLLFPRLVKEVIGEINIEILIPPRRTDRVYKILPVDGEEEEIFHIEYEASPNNKMDKRLLVYHAVLYEEHELPITSVIVYPFEFTGVESPLIERRRGKQVLRFDYEVIQLWKEDARIYVEQKLVPLYGLLPTMDGISDDLLLQAIDEMVQYYQSNEELLRDELLCFRTMLNRAKRLPAPEFKKVDRRLRMFDPLLEEDPWVLEKRAESKAQGIAEERLRSVRGSVLTTVNTRFPSLIELAETKARQTEQWDALNALFVQLLAANGEQTAREILEQFSVA